MMESKNKRALFLSERAREQNRDGNIHRSDGSNLLTQFCSTISERSLLWFRITSKVALILLMLLVSCWAIYEFGKIIGVIPVEPIKEMSDIRLQSDYRNVPATTGEVLDEDNLILATRGQGAQHVRLDGGLSGFWATHDSDNTNGMLSTSILHQIHFDGNRVWFVGENGSLSSCDKDFDNWKLHYGGGGFEPNLDLTEQLTVLAASSDTTIFVVGTREYGLGIYDVLTRQWQSYNPKRNSLRHAHVTALLLHEPWLWVGTEGGLDVFHFQRKNGHLVVQPKPDQAVPSNFDGRNVLSLGWVDDEKKDYVECVLGRGAHLETEVGFGQWRVILDEGDDHLTGLNGPVTAMGLAQVPEGTWLALPKYGLAFYDTTARHLELRNQGLSTGYDNLINATSVQASTGKNGNVEIWTVAPISRYSVGNLGLYHWESSQWKRLNMNESNVVRLGFRGECPLTHRADGTVQLYTTDSQNSTKSLSIKPDSHDLSLIDRLWAFLKGLIKSKDIKNQNDESIFAYPTNTPFFQSGNYEPTFGAAEVGGNQLFIGVPSTSGSNRVVSRYLPMIRSWQNLDSDNSISFNQLRVGNNALWGVKKNGEAGFFSPLETIIPPTYYSVFGSSDLPLTRGKIITAENYKDDFWFVRQETDGFFRTYVYDSNARTIQNRSESLTSQFVPHQLRATSNSLYLWGKESGRGTIFTRTKDSSWRPIQHNQADVKQMLTTSVGMIGLARSNEIFVYPDDGSPTTLLTGCGELRWKKLLPDRFGRVWGISEEGKVAYYHRATGSWTYLINQNIGTDILIIASDGESDKVYIGTTDGLHIWPASNSQVPQTGEKELYSEKIIQLDFDDENLWALSEVTSSQYRSLWKRKSSAKDWERVWQATINLEAPSQENWNQAIWTDFYNDELWFVTSQGALWRYDLRTPIWIRESLIYGQIKNVQMASSGVLWFLGTTGTLGSAILNENDGILVESFRGNPEYQSWMEKASNIVIIIMYVSLSICAALFFLRPALTLIAKAFVLITNFIIKLWKGPKEIPRIIAPHWKIILVLAILVSVLFCVLNNGDAFSQSWIRFILKIVILTGLVLLGLVLFSLSTKVFYRSMNYIDNSWDADKKPPKIHAPYWRLTGLFFLVALLSFLINTGVFQRRITAYQPFLGKYFRDEVIDYSVDGGSLWVTTDEGTWLFSYDGFEVTPQRYLPNEQRKLKHASVQYPRRHESGRWEIRSESSGFSFWRNNKDGTSLVCHFGNSGLVEDDLQSFAVIGKTVLTSTSIGLAEYKVRNPLELIRFTPIVLDPSARLTKDNVMVYCWSPLGTDYCYKPNNLTPWIKSESPWPRFDGKWGIRWQDTPQADEFVQPEFDPVSGRFLADISLHLLKDRNSQPWLQTRGGWRKINEKNFVLDEPLMNPPKEAPSIIQWAASNTWECRRNATKEGTDLLTFIFMHQIYNDEPFGTLGRWPDEDIKRILPSGNEVWIGTAYGLRRRDEGGKETIYLVGIPVSDLSRQGKSLYCRTDRGDYLLSGQEWIKVSSVPPGTFTETRHLNLRLGEGVVFSATERTTGNHLTTELLDFDKGQRRFQCDMIQNIIGEADGFWALTKGGIQRLWIKESLITQHRGFLADIGVDAIRRGQDQLLYALTRGGNIWCYSRDGHWQTINPVNKTTPFTTPVKGKFASAINWQRRYAKDGDYFQLWAKNEQLDFLKGKLTTDYITKVAGTGKQRWQATSSGIVQSQINNQKIYVQQIIPWPGDLQQFAISLDNGRIVFQSPNNMRTFLDLSFDQKQIVCNLPNSSYGYDAKNERWQRIVSRAFYKIEAQFDGYRWRVQHIDNAHPIISYHPQQEFKHVTLNTQGQFPFDSFSAFASRSKELWLAHGAGISVYKCNMSENRSFQASQFRPWVWPNEPCTCKLAADLKGRMWMTLTLLNPNSWWVFLAPPDSNCYSLRLATEAEIKNIPFQLLPIPYWAGRIRGDTLTVRALKNLKTLIIEKNELFYKDTLDYAIQNIKQIEDEIWILTERGLHCLQPDKLKANGKKKSEVATKDDTASTYWVHVIQSDRNNDNLWNENGNILEQAGQKHLALGFRSVAKLLEEDNESLPEDDLGEVSTAIKYVGIIDKDWITSVGDKAARFNQIDAADQLFQLAYELNSQSATLKSKLEIFALIKTIKENPDDATSWDDLLETLSRNSEIDRATSMSLLASLDSRGYYLYRYAKASQHTTQKVKRENSSLIFDLKNNLYFLFVDSTNIKNNQLRPTKFIYSPNGTLWSAENWSYDLYVNGEAIQLRTKNEWRSNDLLIFYPKDNLYFLFIDYANKQDNQLRPAESIYSPNGTLWSADSSGYDLYVNGEAIHQRTKSEWRGNDLLVIDPQEKLQFLFKNYTFKKDNQLRPAEIVTGNE